VAHPARWRDGPEPPRPVHPGSRPAVYLSGGPDRSYAFGKTSLDFEHTVLKEAGFRVPESRLVVQALKAYGEDRITPKIIGAIRKKFTPTDGGPPRCLLGSGFQN